MASEWGHVAALMGFLGVATLFVLVCGRTAWRYRHDRILFFSWLSVLVVFMLIYGLVFRQYLDSW